MTLARLIYIIGIVLIVYAFISGVNFHFYTSDEGSAFNSSYTFKIGVFILGLILMYLGRKSRKGGEEA